MLGYRVPAPDQAMLISGGKQKTQGATFKVVIGHGAWAMPGFRKVRFLGLELHKVEITERCRSHEGIVLNLEAVVAFKVQSDINAVNAAAQRFLGEQKKGEMEGMTSRIFAGHLRSIVGEMPLLDIHHNRDALAQKILEHSQLEMSKFGLTVDSLQIEHLDDGDAGYLDNLARPFLARQQRDADIAQAQAEQESAQAVQEANRKKADQERETAIKVAAIKAETDRAQAESAAAGPLAQADAQREVLAMKRELAEREADLTQQQLVIDIEKPAQAEATRIKIMADAGVAQAEADAKRVKFQAEGEAEQTRINANATAEKNRALARADADRVKLLADAERTRGLAEAEVTERQGLAEAAGERAKAEAVAAEGGAQLELARIQIQPEVYRAIAQGLGLANANVTFLDADGPANLIATVVQQGKVLWDTFTTAGQPQQQQSNEYAGTTDVDTALGALDAASVKKASVTNNVGTSH